MQIHPIIEDTARLQHFCDRFKAQDFVAVDTEFMRDNTFWPKLCLVQIASADEAVVIDPLAADIDLAPLMSLFVDEHKVVKVFHAASQDIEIVHLRTGKTPYPIFDTQIGSMALGLAEQIGYANLVKKWLGIELDKAARLTDWSIRPLAEQQIHYALADVTHLAAIYPQMRDQLEQSGRRHWLDEEMERLADPQNYALSPQTAWKRIKISSRHSDVLGRLQALAAWRETEAEQRDIPRNRVVKDEVLAQIATHPPKVQSDLAGRRGMSKAWRKNAIGSRLMRELRRAKPLDSKDKPPSSSSLKGEQGLIVELLKLLLKIRSRELKVAARLIARSSDLEDLSTLAQEAQDSAQNPKQTAKQAAKQAKRAPKADNILLQGWRFDIFGRDALDLIAGRTGFVVREGKLTVAAIAPNAGADANANANANAPQQQPRAD